MALAEYKRKRDFSRTPEPPAKKAAKKGNSYVIQKHDASRLHYDFRLEMNGVLKSWAVPKGPSLDPAEKRLAVETEDHPLEYGKFEGTIPEGEYGGGTVMVWDHGRWVPESDPEQMYKAGKLVFTLDGKKLHGRWTLVRMSGDRSSNGRANWLLIKKRDEWARPVSKGDILQEQPQSALSGKTLDQIAAGRAVWTSKGKTVKSASAAKKSPPTAKKSAKRGTREKKKEVAAHVAKLEGARKARLPREPAAELATLVEKAPPGDDWLHEIKFDGYRMLCRIDQGQVQFISRNEQDWTARMAELVPAVQALPVGQAVIDGEVVVLDEHGVSSFQLLQNAFKDPNASAGMIYYVFDLLYAEGYNITATPLEDRKSVLEQIVAGSDQDEERVHYSDHIIGSGPEFLQQACRTNLEGVISKRRRSPYVPGRSSDWLKSKCRQQQEFVIGGYTDPSGARSGFGSLLVGYYQPDGKLSYAGRVGTGFNDRTLREMLRKLKARKQIESPFANFPGPGSMRGLHWVRPDMVAQVEFANWTHDNLLRQAAFLGLREDKPARQVTREMPAAATNKRSTRATALHEENGSMTRARGSKAKVAAPKLPESVRITHPERVLYPEQGITKLDLANYYVLVAKWMLPHVADRPLSLVRCPDGVSGKCFFQKHPPQGLSDAVERIKVREKTGMADYLVIRNLEGLLALVQFGALEIHIWGSRADDIERPDRLIFDLDPDPGVPWPRVIEAAFLLRGALDELGLVSFVKTTGGKGLHVVVPVSRRLEWPEVKEFCKAVAELLATTAPDRYLTNMSKAARKGKIFIDYLRNDRGSTSVAAYSTRAREGAPVSTPVTWDELKSLTGAAVFTANNVPDRLAALKRDPWAEMLKVRQSITAAARKRLGLR